MQHPGPVVVIGGGVTGLTVAYRLLETGFDVSVLEADMRPGGQLHTMRAHGAVVEIGAEGFVARSTIIPRLCEALGLDSELIDQKTTDTFVADGPDWTLLAPGQAARQLGFQVPREELGRGIRSLRAGMGRLSDALAQSLADRLRLGCRATGLRRTGSGLEVHRAGGPPIPCHQCVVATPARVAADLVAPLVAGAHVLADSPLLSSLSVIVAVEAGAVSRTGDGSGFIVPPHAQRWGFRACSFVDTKFESRAPAGLVLLRAFFRPDPVDLAELDDAAWTERALACLETPLGLTAPPRHAWVARWPQALPVHDSRHAANVADVEAILAPLQIHLAGSAFHGAGLDAAVQSAERIANRIGETGRT